MRNKLEYDEKEGQGFEFLIKITDQGIGISETDRKNLFKPYFQTSDDVSKKRNSTSHGLGLANCKSVALKMGGDLICTDS